MAAARGQAQACHHIRHRSHSRRYHERLASTVEIRRSMTSRVTPAAVASSSTVSGGAGSFCGILIFLPCARRSYCHPSRVRNLDAARKLSHVSIDLRHGQGAL